MNGHAYSFWNWSLSNISKKGEYRDTDLFTPMITLCMDLEYAHISGLYGHKIYQEEERTLVKVFGVPIKHSAYYYLDRISGKPKVDTSGTKAGLPLEEFWLFTTYEKQIEETMKLAVEYPWRLIPMYHYEPRRWMKKKEDPRPEVVPTGVLSEPWKIPIDTYIAPRKRAVVVKDQLFIGFKMYTPLGYKPLDPRLPHLKDFYQKCADEGIPIINHCSTGGAYTHESHFYLEHDAESLQIGIPDSLHDMKKQLRVEKHCYMKEPQSNNFFYVDGKELKSYSDKEKDHYFRNAYVRPSAWEPVFEKYPKLKLCFAHFGGIESHDNITDTPYGRWGEEIVKMMIKYDNLYVDISCMLFPEKDLGWLGGLVGGAAIGAGLGVGSSKLLLGSGKIGDVSAAILGVTGAIKGAEIGQSLTKPAHDTIFDFFGKKDNRKEALKRTIKDNLSRIQDRLLFGTDWYMLWNMNRGYHRFCEDFKAFFDDIDPSLWTRTTLHNPFRFFGFDDEAKLESIANVLKKAGANVEEVDRGLNKMKKLRLIVLGPIDTPIQPITSFAV